VIHRGQRLVLLGTGDELAKEVSGRQTLPVIAWCSFGSVNSAREP